MTDLYLSQIWLNSRSRDAWRDLSDVQGLHRTLMRAFPSAVATRTVGDSVDDDAPGGARAAVGLLFRPEVDRRTGMVRVLAQSTVVPDWRALPAGYVAPAPGCPDGWATRLLPPAVWHPEVGARRRFRLRANATAKVHGNRVPLRTDGAQLAWLLSHATMGGFRVTLPAPADAVPPGHPEAPRLRDLEGVAPVAGLPPVRLDRDDTVQGWRPGGTSAEGRPSRARLTFEGLTFEGILEVADPERFAAAMRAGIGPAKAYGYGLLSIAPA
jgi:CRISPR system Cascade subunit CasE